MRPCETCFSLTYSPMTDGRSCPHRFLAWASRGRGTISPPVVIDQSAGLRLIAQRNRQGREYRGVKSLLLSPRGPAAATVPTPRHATPRLQLHPFGFYLFACLRMHNLLSYRHHCLSNRSDPVAAERIYMPILVWLFSCCMLISSRWRVRVLLAASSFVFRFFFSCVFLSFFPCPRQRTRSHVDQADFVVLLPHRWIQSLRAGPI